MEEIMKHINEYAKEATKDIMYETQMWNPSRSITKKNIELLQRYDYDNICWCMEEYKEWDYVRFDALIKLLN